MPSTRFPKASGSNAVMFGSQSFVYASKSPLFMASKISSVTRMISVLRATHAGSDPWAIFLMDTAPRTWFILTSFPFALDIFAAMAARSVVGAVWGTREGATEVAWFAGGV